VLLTYFDFKNFALGINILFPHFFAAQVHISFILLLFGQLFVSLGICFSAASYNNSGRGVFIIQFDYFSAVARTGNFRQILCSPIEIWPVEVVKVGYFNSNRNENENDSELVAKSVLRSFKVQSKFAKLLSKSAA